MAGSFAVLSYGTSKLVRCEEKDMDREHCNVPLAWSRRWNDDWDGRHWYPDEKPAKDEKQVVRHVYFIRHGQYNLDDDAHGLTALGEEQSRITGLKLKQMADGLKRDHYGEYKVKWSSLTSSDVLRAKETAEIIGEILGMEREEDPLLGEGTPCLVHPGNAEAQLRRTRPAKLAQESLRIETAYRKYAHREKDYKKKIKNKETIAEDFNPEKEVPKVESTGKGEDSEVEHKFEIVVCHMNVIRYFVMRALQLPPEAWLRLRGDNCGLTELIFYPNGRVGLGRFADQGHLTIEQTTFH